MQVIVHGGAGPLHEARHADAITGCQAATQAAWQALGDGRPALDAAEIAADSRGRIGFHCSDRHMPVALCDHDGLRSSI